MLKNEQDRLRLTHGSIIKVQVICDYCGEEFSIPYRNRVKGFKLTPKDACPKCWSKKREETSLKIYGTRIPSQNIEIRKRESETKGGSGKCVVDYHDQIMELYNSDKNMSVKIISEKLELGRTALRAYMQSLGLDVTGDWYSKHKRTMREKYGVEHAMQCPEIQEKFVNRMLEIYSNPESKQQILDKTQATNQERHGVNFVLQDSNRQNEYESKRKNTRIEHGQLMYDGKSVKELADEKQITVGSMYERIYKYGLECAATKEKYVSSLELLMGKLLDSLDLQYETQKHIKDKIADFYLPEYNMLVEIDGLYWHCDKNIDDDNYHINKKNIYNNSGYRSLFFREDELINSPEIIGSIIKNKVKRSITIGARKCDMKVVNKNLGDKFMCNNHLMSIGVGNYYGLYHDDKLISCICIKRINGQEYEISRFCHQCGYNVVGGFSKLLKFSQSQLNMNSLITFIDMRYGQGNYLKDFGFEFVGCEASFKWTDGQEVRSRRKFSGNKGYKEGFYKLWDCGQAKWRKDFN